MSAAGIQTHEHVLHSGLQKGVVGSCHALAHFAHRVVRSGHEIHRHFLVHLCHILWVSDKLHATKHIPENPAGGRKAAKGVGVVFCHVFLVGGKPGCFTGRRVKALVIAAHGDVIELFTDISGAVFFYLGFGHGQPCRHNELRLVAGTADNSRVKIIREAYDISSGQKAAHAVTEDDGGHIRIFLLNGLVESVHIVYHTVPAVIFGEKALICRVAHGFAVAQMVVCGHGKAVGSHKFGKIIIAVNILSYAVSDLQSAAHITVRHPHTGVNIVFAVG